MQFGLLLALVVTITISENSPHEPVDAVFARLLLALLSTGGVVLFAVAGSAAISRGMLRSAKHRSKWHGWFTRLKRIHMTLWLAAIGVILYALNWPQLVRFNWHLDGAVLIKDLLVMAPIWFPLLLSWAAFYEVEKAAYHAASLQSTSGSNPGGLPRRSRFVWLHARHYLGLCVLPVLALLVFQDLVTLIAPHWQERRLAWLLFLIPLGVLTLVFPQLLSRIWQTSKMAECPLRDRLAALAEKTRVGCRDFRIWRTDGQMLNAAIAGLLPSLRYVFLTDALLFHLRDDEVEAVVVHEMGHVGRHHLMFRMLVLCLPIWVMACFQAFVPDVTDQATQWFMGPTRTSVVTYLVVPVALLASAGFSLGWYSRLMEHDADLFVLRFGQADTFTAAIDRLSNLCGDQRHRSTWLHPSTSQRIQLLQQAMADPIVATRFHRRVNALNIVLVAIWILTPLAGSLVVAFRS